MNTDSVEVCGAQVDEILGRLNAAFRATAWPLDDDPDTWRVLSAPDYRMSLDVYPTRLPDGYDGPPSWLVELRGGWIDLDDERNLQITRWIIGYLYDALAAGTDWELIWRSDDDPGDGIIKARRSVNGPNMPSIEEQCVAADRNLAVRQRSR